MEARLRNEQNLVNRLSASLEQVKSDRDIAQREASILRDELGKLQPSPEIVQAAHSTARIDRIEVVSLLSGGLDRDDVPGDEQISLLIAPKDSRGEIHRVQGELSVRLTENSFAAESEEVASVNFSQTESDDHWHNGIVGRGFRVIIPIPLGLKSRNITAHIRLTTNTGTKLDTLHQMRLTPQGRDEADDFSQ
ncbi:MAG: hypothetical protein HQ518_29885 [Rhodopirellula sp.]|nr:hypothetical protein [Rhodopirellula sp.]